MSNIYNEDLSEYYEDWIENINFFIINYFEDYFLWKFFDVDINRCVFWLFIIVR